MSKMNTKDGETLRTTTPTPYGGFVIVSKNIHPKGISSKYLWA